MSRPAGKYVKRVQTVPTEQQYELLQGYAQEINKPLGALIRESVAQSLIVDLGRRCNVTLCSLGLSPLDHLGDHFLRCLW
jgi:hypothetical protein